MLTDIVISFLLQKNSYLKKAVRLSLMELELELEMGKGWWPQWGARLLEI